MSSINRLNEIYAQKRKAGLVDVKILLAGTAADASSEEIAAELVAINDAIAAGRSQPLDFGDLRWRSAP